MAFASRCVGRDRRRTRGPRMERRKGRLFAIRVQGGAPNVRHIRRPIFLFSLRRHLCPNGRRRRGSPTCTISARLPRGKFVIFSPLSSPTPTRRISFFFSSWSGWARMGGQSGWHCYCSAEVKKDPSSLLFHLADQDRKKRKGGIMSLPRPLSPRPRFLRHQTGEKKGVPPKIGGGAKKVKAIECLTHSPLGYPPL